MALTRKKLNQILKQTRWSGQDIGKMYLLHYVNAVKGRETLDDEQIHTMESALKYAPDQRRIAEKYSDIKDTLLNLNNISAGNYHMFLSNFRELLRLLERIRTFHTHTEVLTDTPYICTNKEYEELKENTQKYINSKNYRVTDLLFDIIAKWLDSRSSKKTIPADVKKLFDALEKTEADNKAVIKTYDFIFNDTEEFINYGSHKGKTHTKTNSSQFYKWTETACKEYIKDNLSSEDLKFFYDVSTLIITNFDKEDIETIEAFYKCKLFFDGRLDSIENYKEIMSIILETRTIKENTPNKLELLNTDLEFDTSNSYYIKHTDEFIKDYPELFNMAKEEFINTHKDLKKALDQTDSIIDLSFTGKQLNMEADESKVIAFNSETEAHSIREYLKANQIYNAGIAIYSGKNNVKKGHYIAEAYSKLETEEKIIYSISEQYTKDVYAQLETALNAVIAYNLLINVYSDILRVDLTPLLIPMTTIKNCITQLNTQIYSLYYRQPKIIGLMKQRQDHIKKVFRPLNINDYELAEDKKQAIYEELEALKKDSLDDFLTCLANAGIMRKFKTKIFYI